MNTTDIIEVKDNVTKDLLAVALRQILIGVFSAIAIKSSGVVLPDGAAEGAAAMMIVVGAAGYGWVKTWRNKRMAVALADSAEIGRVVK